MAGDDSQIGLFGGSGQSAPRLGRIIPAAPVRPEHAALATRLPSSIRLGASTWSFPGWSGIVFQGRVKDTELVRDGLRPYASHPLLRTVSLDRTYHGPIDEAAFRAYAEQVPADFRMVVKAHEYVTRPRFPSIARYGTLSGQVNPKFFDVAYAIESVITPAAAGLGDNLGALLFQFPKLEPFDLHAEGGFIARLERFLAALPKGPVYAVEVRNPELLGDALASVLRNAGVCPVINGWGHMPPVSEQVAKLPWADGPAVIGRWLLPPGGEYEEQGGRFKPFTRIVEEDPVRRNAFAKLAAGAAKRNKPALITVSNNVEGCAPESVFLLAKEIGRILDRQSS